MKKINILVVSALLQSAVCVYGNPKYSDEDVQVSSIADVASDEEEIEDDSSEWNEKVQTKLHDFTSEELETSNFYTGICIYDLTADSLFFDYNGNKIMRPASTQKLITAVAALDYLGADCEYVTSAYISGKVENGVLNGDVYVVGGFDPAFNSGDLRRLARAISNEGIKRINGKVYGDVSMKDTLIWGQGWCWDDAPSESEPYLTPLVLNRGCVTVSAGPENKPMLEPSTSFVELQDRTGGGGKFKATRNWVSNGNIITASGNMKRGNSKTISVYRPELYFLCTLTDFLKTEGITFSADSSSVVYGLKELPSENVKRVYRCSRTVEQILVKMMKESDNLYAESMFYLLASRASDRKWVSHDEAIDRIESVINKAGGSSSLCKVADGSGVSLYNYTTACVETALLRYAYRNRDRIYKYLYPSLPVSGMDGTLSNRMKHGNSKGSISAKTGTLEGVSSLSGYCNASNGHLMAFTVICNGVLRGSIGRSVQDKICHILTH